MEQVMFDVYVAEATIETDYQNFDTPEKKEAYIREIFRSHNITQARWDTSLSWYSDQIDLYLKMNDSVKARLKRAQAQVDSHVAQESLRQSSYTPSHFSTSFIPSFYSFSEPDVRKGFRFRLDSAEIAARSVDNELLFSFKVMGIPPEFAQNFSAMLALTYSDTTLYAYRRITENRKYQIPVSRFIENDTLVSLNGFVRLQHRGGDLPHILLHEIFLGTEQALIEQLEEPVVATDSVTPLPIQPMDAPVPMDSL